MRIVRENTVEILISLIVGSIFLSVEKFWYKASIEFSLFILLASSTGTFAITLLFKIASRMAEIDNLKGIQNLIFDQVRMIKDAPQEVISVIVGYSRRFFGDISSESQKMLIANYLMLLEESLEVTTESFFATSLLTPTTWFSDKKYSGYFKKQEQKKKKFPDMDMKRIFILSEKDFFGDDKVEELAKQHFKAGIKIGYCDKTMLDEKELRDLVIFESNKNKWVVEGGKIPQDVSSGDPKTVIDVRVHYSETALSQLIRHWKEKVDANTQDFVNIKQLQKKKRETLPPWAN